MYSCSECGYEFQNPVKLIEKHALLNPPYESIYVCPKCKSTCFEKVKIKHCHCCGAKLNKTQTDYCSEECKLLGDKLWKMEIKRKKLLSDTPLFKLVREVEIYNKHNNTSYSYGQYVALIKNNKGGKLNAKK